MPDEDPRAGSSAEEPRPDILVENASRAGARAIGARPAAHTTGDDAASDAEDDPIAPAETADKTDMSAVGDDGQVFGG